MPSDLPLICPERLRLLREYSDAADGYANGVRVMTEFVLACEEARAGEARRSCRALLDRTERCRLALYQHESDHDCCGLTVPEGSEP